MRIASFVAGQAGRSLRHAIGFPGRVTRGMRSRVPERLLIAPQDIRTSDPTIAADIGAGYFAFGGKIASAQRQSPFLVEPASEAWARQLAGFGWLRHLRAADRTGARQGGRRLVDDFIQLYPKPSPAIVWEPRVTARRLLSWLSQSPVILDGADRAFYNRFMQALSEHQTALDRAMRNGLTGNDRLLAALALAEFGLCAQGAPNVQRRGTEALVTEINAQILPDGGHVSRNPQTLIDLLLDLLPLRQAYAARGIQAPDAVLNAIDRMMPMLRLFRHGDGALALFNGMGLTAPEQVATILAYDDARAQPLTNARQSGYQRIEAAGTILIVDAGAVPPKVFSTEAHAGCLSFEFSSGINRIVINCGTPEISRANAREAARSTAAHSTLVLDDTSCCRFAANAGLQRWLGDQILSGPTDVTVERTQVEDGVLLSMSHDGYVSRLGFIHQRALKLTHDGRILEGRDRLTDTGRRKFGSRPYVLRFHLHPLVRPVPTDGGIRLDMRDGEQWMFEADTTCIVEPSILFAASGGPRAAPQIVVAAESGGQPEVRWRFRQILLPGGPTP